LNKIFELRLSDHRGPKKAKTMIFLKDRFSKSQLKPTIPAEPGFANEVQHFHAVEYRLERKA